MLVQESEDILLVIKYVARYTEGSDVPLKFQGVPMKVFSLCEMEEIKRD